jgi:hypothetical protein
MKHNKLVLGGLGIAAIAIASLIASNLSPSVDSKYVSTKGVLDESTSANDYAKFVRSKMVDSETGDIITESKLRQVTENLRMQSKSLSVEWSELGPDNIGGRTRAVLVDRFNQSRVWAGGVTGGLYKSEHRANWWERVSNFPGNQFISHIVQDASGNTYVGTGSLAEGGLWIGNGLYVTPDNGDTWELVDGTENFDHINRMASNRENDEIFIAAGGNGLYKYTYGGTLESVSGYGASNAQTIVCSDDGQVVVCSDINNRTWVSNDGGDTWLNKTGNGAGEISSAGSRTEYAISKQKSDGSYSIYVSKSAGNNSGQWISLDSGNTWSQHTPATGANIDNGVIDFRDQGGWNNVVAFDPTNPKRVIVGGIDLHEWEQVIDNPPSGGWNKISLWFVDPTSPIYAHADHHALFWDENNVLFNGNDGGVAISEDFGATYYEANRGYNISTFFKIAYDRNGAVVGGTQDNGCLYNDFSNHTYQEFKRATGGDGFSTAISFYNPDVMITSSQYNNLRRSGDGGETFNTFNPDFPAALAYGPIGVAGSVHPFHTTFVLAEYFDENSEDSLTFIPQMSYSAGETIKVPSRATGDTIMYTSPTDVFFDDTLVYFPDSTRTEYVVTDADSGIEYDLGLNNFTPFATASGDYPPQNGDSLLVETASGVDTVVVGGSSPYDFYVGVNEQTNQTVDMGRDTMIFNVPWDTLTVQDPFQSWFVFSTTGSGGEIWGTRDALRLSESNPQWVRLADNLGGAAVDIEFSEDLNHMFICGGSFIGSTQYNNLGRIFRIDGLGSVYTSDPNFKTKTDIDEGATATDFVTISTNSGWSGIGIDPRNPDDLVATQGFNGNVFRSSDATSAAPSLTQVGSQNGNAFYDVIIDRDDSDILFAATFTGVSCSDDGGATWTDVSDPSFAGTPSYHILQSWRTWDEGNKMPGAIYLGTHGRGIFRTEAVLSTVNEDDQGVVNKKPKSTLEVYPNPARYNSTLVVDLKQASNVNVLFFNLNGSVVKSINRTNMHEGKNEIFFSASDLPQGTYIIRVQAGQQIETTKYIKM